MTTSDHGERTSPDSLPRWTTLAVEWLVGAILLVGPLAFGGTETWGQAILLGLILAASLVTLVGAIVSRDFRFVRTWAYLPIAMLLLVAFAQLIPLSSGLRSALMPGANHLRETTMTLAGVSSDSSLPSSLYALATQRQLRLLVGGVLLFTVVLQVYAGGRQRRRRLLRTIVLIGLAEASLGLFQYAMDAETILGLVRRANPYSGTFANHSHFGQFINLTIGAAVALLVVELRGLRAAGHTWAGVRDAVLNGTSHWDIWAAAALVCLGPIAVLVALTRGGFLSLCAGAFVAAAMLALMQSRRRRRRRDGGGTSDAPIVALIAGAAVLLVVVAIGFNAAYDRVASLRDLHESSGGRGEIIRDALNVWRSSPWIGTGLGTHAFVFPAFDRSGIPDWASHAENEYVQWLEETGAIGLGAVLLFLLVIYAAIFRGARRLRAINRAGHSTSRAPELALPGLALGLIAVTCHSATDFGQHLPGIAFLSAVLCALVLVIDREGAANTRPVTTAVEASKPRSAIARPTFALAGLAIVAAAAWMTPTLQRDWRAESAFWDATISRGLLDADGWAIDSPTYRDLLVQGAAAHDAQPRDVEYTFWLNASRWEAIEQQRDPGSPTLDPQLAGWTRQMIDELLNTARECPTFGRPLAFAGQLQRQLPDQTPASTEQAQALVMRGAELAPYDPIACFNAGEVAAAAGQRDRARQLLLQAMNVGSPRPQVVEALVRDVNDVPAARLAASGSLASMDRLVAVLATLPQYAAECAQVTAQRDAMVDELAAGNSDPGTLDRLASRFADAGQVERAIDCLSRAAAHDYANAERRMRLANLLSSTGRLNEAVEQASIALRFRPGDAGITQQIEQWRSTLRRQTRQPAADNTR